MGIITENFESQVKLIAELAGGIREQLIGIREMAAKNTEDIKFAKMDLREVGLPQIELVCIGGSPTS